MYLVKHLHHIANNCVRCHNLPSYVLPADEKLNARLIISEIIISTLNELDMQYPVTDDAKKTELAAIREQLLSEND